MLNHAGPDMKIRTTNYALRGVVRGVWSVCRSVHNNRIYEGVVMNLTARHRLVKIGEAGETPPSPPGLSAIYRGEEYGCR